MIVKFIDTVSKKEYEISLKNGMVILFPNVEMIEESRILFQSDYSIHENMLNIYNELLSLKSRFKIEFVDENSIKTFTANIGTYYIDYLDVDFYCPVDRIYLTDIKDYNFDFNELILFENCEKTYIDKFKKN